MSYLDRPRLHFAGRFFFTPATLNNDPRNFNAAKFIFPQLRRAPGGNLPDTANKGDFSPFGTNSFDLQDCVVRSVVGADESADDLPQNDPLLGAPVQTAPVGSLAKMVDLDPQQQLVTEMYGLTLQVGTRDLGMLRGKVEVSAIADLWARCPSERPNARWGASLQSVVLDPGWDEQPASPILRNLRDSSPKRLSIKLVLDGYCDDADDPAFLFGRIVGTIGPATDDEPATFVIGRALYPAASSPLGRAYAQVDPERSRVVIDLGNSIPTVARAGALDLSHASALHLVILDGANRLDLGNVVVTDSTYTRQSGILEVTVTPDQLNRLRNLPLAVLAADERRVLLGEDPKGLNVRAEKYVYRLDPGQRDLVGLIATQFGRRAAGMNVALQYTNAVLQLQVGPGANPPTLEDNPLGFAMPGATDDDGRTSFAMTPRDPGNPRGAVDGQVYAVQYFVAGQNVPPLPLLPSDVVNVRVFSGVEVPEAPTWVDHVSPILHTYANLYPGMHQLIDLDDFDAVVEDRKLISFVLEVDYNSPNYMPVTRDLSTAKRDLIRRWLEQEKPLYAFPKDDPDARLQRLQQRLQVAIELEHATIPPYLFALYSIKPGTNREVAETLESIVTEEMLHVALAANVLIAVGGQPSLKHPLFLWHYPRELPLGLRPGCVLTLERCSRRQIENVFMSLEQPEEDVELLEKGQDADEDVERLLDTVGAFYEQIRKDITALGEDIFKGDRPRQVSGWKGLTGADLSVTGVDSANAALDRIVHQGEGTSPDDPSVHASEGEDGQPEFAHYYRLMQVIRGRSLVPADGGFKFEGPPITLDESQIWPVVGGLRVADLPANSLARARCERFNRSYCRLLELLDVTFNGRPERLDSAIGLMFSLKMQAMELVQTPIEQDGNPAIGPNAGPTFEYVAPE